MGKLIHEIKDLMEFVKLDHHNDVKGHKVPAVKDPAPSAKKSPMNKQLMLKGKDPKQLKPDLKQDSKVPGHKIPHVKKLDPSTKTTPMNKQVMLKGSGDGASKKTGLDHHNDVKGHKVPKVKNKELDLIKQAKKNEQ